MKRCTDSIWSNYKEAAFCGLFVILFSLPGRALSDSLGVNISSRAVGEIISLASLKDKNNVPLYQGEQAWTRNRLELTAEFSGYQIAYLRRYDYSLEFNQATAEFYHRHTNNLPYSQDEVPLRFSVWHGHLEGVKFSRRLAWGEGWYWQPALYLLRGVDFQDGKMTGMLEAEGGDLKGVLDLHYHYSEDWLFDHRAAKPAGLGVGLDIALGWQGENASVSLVLEDAWGFVQWQRAPFSEGRVDTRARSGLPGRPVTMNAVFSGMRYTKPYRQRLQPYAELVYRQYRGAWGWVLEVEHFMEEMRFRPGILWKGSKLEASLSAEAGEKFWLLGLAAADGGWSVRAGLDDLAPQRSQNALFEAGWLWRW